MYVVAMWGLSQGAAELGPLFGAPDWFVRALVIVGVLLLPVVVVLAWMFDLGLRGIVRDAGQNSNSDSSGMDPAHAFDRDLADQPTIGAWDLRQGAVIVHWTEAGGRENAVLIAESFYLGRGNECRVRFYDPLVSRKHARVYFEEGTWHIEDLGSRNGTLVDDQQIERSILENSSVVRLNESGPGIALEIVAPGDATQSAMTRLSAAPSVAHIRPQ